MQPEKLETVLILFSEFSSGIFLIPSKIVYNYNVITLWKSAQQLCYNIIINIINVEPLYGFLFT